MSYCVQLRQTNGLCLFTETKQHSWKACTNHSVGDPQREACCHGGRQTGSHASQRRGSFLQPERCILLLLMKGPDDVVLPDPSSAAAMPSTSSVTNQLALVKAAVLRALILIPILLSAGGDTDREPAPTSNTATQNQTIFYPEHELGVHPILTVK